jgi:hypothetical protein
MNASMTLLLTDLLALLVVALAAWKVVVVASARFWTPAGSDRSGCSGCDGCTKRPSPAADDAPG